MNDEGVVVSNVPLHDVHPRYFEAWIGGKMKGKMKGEMNGEMNGEMKGG